METKKWLGINGLSCFLIIFGSTLGTYIFTITWIPRVTGLTARLISSFLYIFRISSYIVLIGSIIALVGALIVLIKRYAIARIIMIIGFIIAISGVALYIFGAVEAIASFTIDGLPKIIVSLPFLTINLTFELIGIFLGLIKTRTLVEERLLYHRD